MSNYGGPAFPGGSSYYTVDLVGNRTDHKSAPLYAGMTLRDYFAAHFIERAQSLVEDQGARDLPTAACLAYQMADAMLAARALPPKQQAEGA